MWMQVLVVAAGVWLAASPGVLNLPEPAATVNHVLGPPIAALATISLFEVTRPVRWVNLFLGLCLLLAPGVLNYTWPALGHSLAVGLAVLVLTPWRGERRGHHDGGWSALWRRSGPAQSL